MSSADVIEKTLDQRAQSVSAIPIEVNLIDPSPFQARKRFEPEALNSLAESIRQKLLHDIHVRPVGVRYELISGERRWRAVKDVLKWTHIDAKVIQCTDQEAAEFGATENLQREDLLPSEKARQIQILKEQGVPVERIVKLAGSVAKMENLLRLADLPLKVQAMLDTRQINMAAVSVLANIDGATNQIRAAEMAQTGQLTNVELRARTQHLPRRTNPRAPAVAEPFLRVVSPEILNRLFINLQQELSRFSSSDLRTARQREILKANTTNLLAALRDLREQLQ